MFKKVLIANRGEIAVRILRACKEMGIKTVAVHSTVDHSALHVRLADESVCIGPGPSTHSYLNKTAVISAAIITNADAIHPGYGFLAENADFADMVIKHGIGWIGPKVKHIIDMGDKMRAKIVAKQSGLQTVPGSDSTVETVEEAEQIAKKYGYPVILKASSGGGGRGMRIVTSDHEMESALMTIRSEAEKAFGNSDVYIEKFLKKPRHIEVQVLGDNHGNAVHFGERDCSIQRKHQKIIEETPSPGITQEEREYINNLSVKAIQKMGYCSTGTVEYLYENGQFYFIEMNTRIQVEHPITEEVNNIDLIKEQIKVALNQKITYTQKDIKPQGHAIECRINAEDPNDFTPHPGLISNYYQPGGKNVRIDSCIFNNYKIPVYYDSLISKIIATGKNRDQCIATMQRALKEFAVTGIKTNTSLHIDIITDKDFISGDYDINWLTYWLKDKKSKKR